MPQLKRPTLRLLLPLLVGILGACQTGYKEGQTPVSEGIRTTQITTGNEWLCERLEIRDVKQKRGTDQKVQIEFELINTWPNLLQFEWAFIWLDADGFRLADPEEYESMALDHRQRQVFRATAPSSRAVGWQLNVRRP